MFDIGWGELLLIGIVALIAIGPKELPGALRTLGQWMAKIRRMASEFQNQFHDAIREAELADLKKDVDDMAAKAQSYANFNPLDDVQKDIESAVGPLGSLDTPPATATNPTADTPAANTPADTATLVADAPPAPDTPPPPPVAEAAPAAAPAEPAAADAPAKPDAGKAA
jgi:sec-independent protein translocase protein TatB